MNSIFRGNIENKWGQRVLKNPGRVQVSGSFKCQTKLMMGFNGINSVQITQKTLNRVGQKLPDEVESIDIRKVKKLFWNVLLEINIRLKSSFTSSNNTRIFPKMAFDILIVVAFVLFGVLNILWVCLNDSKTSFRAKFEWILYVFQLYYLTLNSVIGWKLSKKKFRFSETLQFWIPVLAQ